MPKALPCIRSTSFIIIHIVVSHGGCAGARTLSVLFSAGSETAETPGERLTSFLIIQIVVCGVLCRLARFAISFCFSHIETGPSPSVRAKRVVIINIVVSARQLSHLSHSSHPSHFLTHLFSTHRDRARRRLALSPWRSSTSWYPAHSCRRLIVSC